PLAASPPSTSTTPSRRCPAPPRLHTPSLTAVASSALRRGRPSKVRRSASCFTSPLPRLIILFSLQSASQLSTLNHQYLRSLLLPRCAAIMPPSATVTNQAGPQSGTSWIVTSSPLFSLLGKENKSRNAIASFRSPATSLRGLVVTTDEPICSLHILLSTESNGGDSGAGGAWHHPDDGLPHTLEHLVFLGSETHPHKGILDKLANRCMADGTNAWTATDHTAYTLSTAGSEGAINLMPIFADHVLFPTLTDSGFVTEVHHVNGKGENKGVVYCEMQGRENSEGSLVDRAVMDLLYPPSDTEPPVTCGYSAETGGKMANLRTLTVDKVRRYHEEYYTPDNTILILTGNVQSDDFFRALDEVEALVLKRRGAATKVDGRPGCRAGRPWVKSTVPPMISDKVGVYPPYKPNEGGDAKALSVSFPSEDESRGTISIAWRGPPYADRSAWQHLSLLWDYLTASAASPLQLAFVENDDPLCADIGPAHDIFTEGYTQLWFQEVDVERMEAVVPLFYDVIAKQAGVINDAGEAFDLARMRTVIKRARRKTLEASERRPTRAIVDGIVRNFMYGPRAGETNGDQVGSETSPQDEMEALHSDVDPLPYLDEAEGKLTDASYWQGLMKEYILDRPMAVVLGKPSAAMSKEIQDGDTEREAKQAKDLGEEGLKRLAKTVEDAMVENEHPIPEEILTSLPVPDLEKVPSIPLFNARLSPSSNSLALEVTPESVRGVSANDSTAIVSGMKKDTDSTSIPFHADLSHIDSAFIFAAVGVDTTPLTREQRLYMPILDEILFKLPATLESGENLSKEEFVNKLQDETVSYSSGLGLLGGSIPQMSYVSVQVENTDDGTGISTALQWIRRVFYLTKITTESVKTAVQRLISEIPPQIRYGPAVVSTVAAELNYDPEKSNSLACNFLRQKPFLSKIYEGMEKGDDSGIEDVVKELEGIRKTLFQTTNMHAFVAANLRTIPKLVDTIVTFLSPPDGGNNAPGRLIENVAASSVLKKEAKESGGEGAVCALSAIESGFLTIIAPGIKAYDPNRASLLVAIEYLTALEGDFWVKLRGAGLTYSYSISDSTDSELIKFGLFKCTDVPAAFETASNIITEYASGKSKVSAVGLENAKASLAYQIISGRSSKLSAATSSFVRTFKNEKMDYDKFLLSRIAEVSADDVMHAVIKHLVPIFDPSSKLAIACPVNKLNNIHDYFTKRGWTALKKVPEEKLFTAFADNDADEKPAELPEKVPGMSMFLPGAFAAQFRCACPKCDR
ncbi:hypothetical protein ACHAWF_010434, partial [Thalassiosira exigua]